MNNQDAVKAGRIAKAVTTDLASVVLKNMHSAVSQLAVAQENIASLALQFELDSQKFRAQLASIRRLDDESVPAEPKELFLD